VECPIQLQMLDLGYGCSSDQVEVVQDPSNLFGGLSPRQPISWFQLALFWSPTPSWSIPVTVIPST
jgi:hypothetical protein